MTQTNENNKKKDGLRNNHLRTYYENPLMNQKKILVFKFNIDIIVISNYYFIDYTSY